MSAVFDYDVDVNTGIGPGIRLLDRRHPLPEERDAAAA
jgi:hypothetical protein